MINLNAMPGNVTLNFDIRDAQTDGLIQNANFGIMNLTNNEWRNSTVITGAGYTDSTGASFQYPLKIATTVRLAASATGYLSGYQDVIILNNNQLSTLYLTPNTLVPQNGNWNLLVTVLRNLDAQPVHSATVQLTTGINGPGTYSAITGDTGTASFLNISASSSAAIDRKSVV